MGLLEKALRYKKDINRKGKVTLIDRIKGPAEMEVLEEVSPETEPGKGRVVDFAQAGREHDDELLVLDQDDLTLVPEESLKEEKGEVPELSVQEEPAAQPALGSSFHDYLILYEVSRDIIKSDSFEELFDILLFSVMGQIAASSSSVIIPENEESGRWIIDESRGISLRKKELEFQADAGIMKEVLKRKAVTDIEEFSEKEIYREDYYRFISIDARMLIPMVHDNEVLGLLVLGDKISAEDYTDEEIDFLRIITDYSAVILRNLNVRAKKNSDLDSLRKQIRLISDIDRLHETAVAGGSIEKMTETVMEELRQIGVESYAVFSMNRTDDRYIPRIVEKEDYLSLKEDKFYLRRNNRFIRFAADSEGSTAIADFRNSQVLGESFTDSQINKMSMFHLYPAKIGNKLMGFICLFRTAAGTDMKEIDNRLSRMAQNLFLYLNVLAGLDYRENRYVDNVEYIYSRINDEITNARDLSIPLTLVLFSIKNYKRYYNIYGYDEVRCILDRFEEIIRERLSDPDFSVRYDRHKILLILPGKDRKYAVPLASAIRNEVVHSFSRREIQLLITFLTAEFPEDGGDIYSLIDAVD